MAHSFLFVIIYFGIIGVNSKVINILRDDYYLSRIKTYNGTAPTFIQIRFVNGISGALIMNAGVAYYIGSVDTLQKWVELYGKPTISNNFTDEYGNTLFCKEGELELKRTKRRYKIQIGPSAHTIGCHLDRNKHNAFLISGKTKNSTAGKLYAFNIKNIVIRGDNVLTEEVLDLGDNIAAVTASDMGIIMLSENVPDKNAFNILVYKESSKIFENAMEQAAIKIKNHFTMVLQRRINQLVNVNLRLRQSIQPGISKVQNYSISLPEKVTDILIPPRYDETDSVLDKMREKMKLLYERNTIRKDFKKYVVLGNRSRKDGIIPLPKPEPESYWCKNRSKEYQNGFKCAPEDQFENKIKDYLVSEKTFVKIEEWLNTSADDMNGILGVINILGLDYEVNMPKNNFTDYYGFPEYQGEILGLIGAKFKSPPFALHDAAEYKTFNRRIQLSYGNELNCASNGRVTFVDHNTKPSKNYTVKTANSSFTFQCYGDLKRNRAFLLSGDKYNASKGKLYAIDTSEVDIVKGVVVPEEIAEVGDSISVVTVRGSDGVIMLNREVTGSEEKVYKMLLLKPTSEEVTMIDKKQTPTDFFIAASHNSSKIYSAYDPEESEFINAIVEVENSLIHILDEKWKFYTEKLIKDQKEMETIVVFLITYFAQYRNKVILLNLFKSILPLRPLNNTRIKGTIEEELSTFIIDMGNNLYNIYVKEITLTNSEFHLLDLEVVCDENFKSHDTETDEQYCVRSSAWRERETFHERLQSFYDEIMH